METTKKIIRVAVYSRISSDDEGTELGVQRQEEDCLRRIEREEGWVLAGTPYRENDTGASARSRKRRKVYPAMLEDARAGKFDVILAYSNSRLTRRPMELEDLITLHDDHGTEIRTIVSGDDDLGTAAGRMVARIKASVDAAEAEQTGERVARKQAQKRAEGFIGTQRAFGWAMVYEGATRLPDVLDEREGPALATALQMVREGMSVGAVARYWNGLDLTTARGNAWSTTRTKDALVRWRNAGLMEHNGVVVGEGSWEPVCTREELEEVRALLNRKGARRGQGRPPSNLLSNIATCGACGRPLFIGWNNQNSANSPERYYTVYRCSGSQDQSGRKCFLSIKQEFLEGFVIRAVREVLFFGGVENLTPSEDEAALVKTLSRERAQIENEERQIGELMGARTLSITAGTAALSGLTQRRESVEAEIAAITSRYALRALFDGSKGILDRAVNIAKEFNALDIDQRREIVRGLFSITVQPGRDPLARVQIVRTATGETMANEWADDEFATA